MNKIKKTISELISLKGVSLKTFPLLLAGGIVPVMAYISRVDTHLTEFYKRAIGDASINGVDAPVRVPTFWICIVLFIVSFFLGSYVIDKIKKYLKTQFSEYPFKLENTLFFEFGMLILINELIFFYAVFASKGHPSLRMPIYLAVMFSIVCLHALISVFRARKKLDTETPLNVALAFIFPIPLTYFLLLATSFNTTVVTVVSIKTVVIYVVLYLAVRFLLGGALRPNAAAYALIPLSFLPVSYIIGNEAQYTLTKHNIAVSPQIIALGIGVALIAAAIAAYLAKRESNNNDDAMRKIKNIVLPVLLISLGVFSAHVQTISPNFDLLHNGNKTLPVQQLFQFGNIPLLDIWPHQHLPIFSYLYVLLNGLNFLEPNIWLGVSDSVVAILICYFVLRQFVSARWAAFLILFTPVLSYANPYYMTGLLPLIYLNKMRTRRKTIDYALFFGLALAAFVYQSSSGRIAVIASFVLIALSCSSKKDIMNAIKAVAITAGIPVVVYCSYVLFRGENIFDRLSLISALGDSDILIGSYTSIVSSRRTPFEVLTYYGLFPLLGILSAVFALRAKEKTTLHYGIVFIVVACLISSLRSLARHSLMEGLPTDFYPLLFVIVPYILIKNKTIGKVVSFITIAFFVITPYVWTSYGVAANGIKDYTFQRFEVGDERSDTLNGLSYPSNLRTVLDTVLTKDQTFFETINAYLLYSLMERECTFLDVSTLLIQYERPQIAYLHTLEKLYERNKVPIIITGKSDWWGSAIDGIPSELSLFKLEEWIYAHYEPWIWVDGFHLWKAKNSSINLPAKAGDAAITVLADVPISVNDINSAKDITFEYHNEVLTLNCGSNDPQISLSLPDKDFNRAVENGNAALLQIVYKTSVDGYLRVFYDFLANTETDSFRVGVAAIEEEYVTAYFPLPKNKNATPLKRIRLDPPDNSTFEIKSISIIEHSLPVITAKDTIKQDFNMLMLPYIWGNYDKKVNKNFPQEQQRVAGSFALDTGIQTALELDPNIDKSSGNYIYFRISADQGGTFTLSYGNDIINKCTFNIVAGDHNYLIRISSQYNWVNEPQTGMDIVSSIPISIERVSVLKGD